jgi:RNA polymerase sigma-70 factor (ECF subfamily)
MALGGSCHFLKGVEPAAGGQRMNFRDFYDEHMAFVWRSLRRLGMPDDHLKDATQEVFAVVYRKMPDTLERPEAMQWLFCVCARTAKDFRRRAYLRREVLDDSHFKALVDPSGDALAELQRHQDRELFRAAISQLDDAQREVFILFELEAMTGDEISETLRIPVGTVYSRLRLARQAFQRTVIHLAAKQRGVELRSMAAAEQRLKPRGVMA